MSLWNDAESDDLDRQVKASRRREYRERRAGWRMSRKGIRAATTLDPTGPARGVLSGEELKRRADMERAMARRAQRGVDN